MHRIDKYSQHSSIIWPDWPNGWVFVFELSGCRFEYSCSHLHFRFRACFEQGVLRHSGNYRVWIHSETRRWHDKNIQSMGVLDFLIKDFFVASGSIKKLFSIDYVNIYIFSVNIFSNRFWNRYIDWKINI